MKQIRLLTLLALLMTAATGAWAGTQATGYFESCTAYHGSIRVKGWAYDPDQTATSIQVHAYIWYGSSVGTSNDQRMPAVGINTDVSREDVNNAKGITGVHGFDRYITVPAGTYTVQIYAIDKTGDGNPKIPGTSGNPATYTVTVTADPYNITYDANGGSGAPAAQQKGEYVKINLSAAEPTRAGYVFKEWNTKQDGSGISYAPGAAYTADGDATLYAKWEAIPYTVSLNDGTDNPTTWKAKVGTGNFGNLPLEGVTVGQTVTLQYNGRLKVKGVKATSDAVPGPFDNVTASDKGKVIGADGKIYADATAATAASTTAVAMIAYVGNDAETNTKYNHGLAIALTDASTAAKWDTNTNRYCLSPFSSAAAAKGDMAGIANTDAIVKDGHTHAAASAARNYNSGTHPDGTSEWFLPSAGQWDKMITAAGGGAELRTKAGLASDAYWSSSESSVIDYRAWQYNFSSNGLYNNAKTDEKHVRAVLAF